MMFPEFRLGFLVIPKKLIQAFKIAKYYADTRTSYLEQATLATFIAQGHYARHVRRIRKTCYERQKVMIDAIQRYIPKSIRVEPSDSGIHLVCWLSDSINEREIIDKCRQSGLGAQPLSRYCQNKSSNQAILLGFAAHQPSDIVAGIKTLAKIII